MHKVWGHTLVKCHLALIGAHGHITEVPSFLEIPWRPCFGWIQMAPHRTVLQERKVTHEPGALFLWELRVKMTSKLGQNC